MIQSADCWRIMVLRSRNVWDQQERTIDTLEPQESRHIRITLSGPLYETTCPNFMATCDGQDILLSLESGIAIPRNHPDRLRATLVDPSIPKGL